MPRGILILGLALFGACASPPKPEPLIVDQGADQEPLVGRRVQVRGYFLRSDYKGFPALYAGPTKEEDPRFLVSIPDSIDWRSRLKRELVVVGVVDELPPFTEEQRRPGKIPQGFSDGVRFIRVETIEDATSR